MREQIAFFDFFESFVPPRELRLLLHDAVVTGGALDREQRTLELDVAAGEPIRRRRAVAPKDNGYPLDGGPEDCPPADIGSGAYSLSHNAQIIIA